MIKAMKEVWGIFREGNARELEESRNRNKNKGRSGNPVRLEQNWKNSVL